MEHWKGGRGIVGVFPGYLQVIGGQAVVHFLSKFMRELCGK
jgi:hypothetical protein